MRRILGTAKTPTGAVMSAREVFDLASRLLRERGPKAKMPIQLEQSAIFVPAYEALLEAADALEEAGAPRPSDKVPAHPRRPTRPRQVTWDIEGAVTHDRLGWTPLGEE